MSAANPPRWALRLIVFSTILGLAGAGGVLAVKMGRWEIALWGGLAGLAAVPLVLLGAYIQRVILQFYSCFFGTLKPSSTQLAP